MMMGAEQERNGAKRSETERTRSGAVATHRTTMTGTGEWETAKRETEPMPGAPSARPHDWSLDLEPFVPTTRAAMSATCQPCSKMPQQGKISEMQVTPLTVWSVQRDHLEEHVWDSASEELDDDGDLEHPRQRGYAPKDVVMQWAATKTSLRHRHTLRSSASLFLSRIDSSRRCASSLNSSCACGSVLSAGCVSGSTRSQQPDLHQPHRIPLTPFVQLNHPDRHHLVPILHQLGHEPLERVVPRLIVGDRDGEDAGIAGPLVSLALCLRSVSALRGQVTGGSDVIRGCGEVHRGLGRYVSSSLPGKIEREHSI
jgi:hypothetical protein